MEIPFPPAPNDPEAFYLLKITGRDNIGDRLPDPNDGRMKVLEYFTPEDIGVLQSTTLIQGLNENEFTPIPGLQNVSMIGGEQGTQWNGLINESYTCTIRGVNAAFGTEELGPVAWTFPAIVTVPDMQVSEAQFATNLVQQLETKNAVNFVHAQFTLRLKYSEMTDFNVTTYIDPNTGNTLPAALQANIQTVWNNINNTVLNSMLKADFRVTIPPIANINSISEFIEQFKSIRDGNESYVAFAGQVAQLANTAPENIIDAINKMYGATISDQNQSINQSSVPNSFFDTYNKLRSVEKNVEILTGPGLTDPAYWAQFTTAVGSPTANFVSGFFKNKRDIENLSGNANFTGLSDTPTGYLSGQYLISTASGIDYQTISGLSKEISDEISSSQTLSFTGLSGTPSNYEKGKFLVSTDDGIEYTGNLSGVISSEEINWSHYNAVGNLPNASDYHGMFAHVHSEGAAYMAHNGNWEKIYPSQGSSTFKNLTDTPNNFENGKILESTANGTQWVNPPAGTTEFKNLTDTPNNFENGKILESTANGLVWVDKPAGGGGGGSSTFEGLTNTPNAFAAGTAGQFVTVNSTEDGVQFSQLDLAGSNLNFITSQSPVQFLHKPLTSNITSNQTITDFNFAGLEVGKTYKLNAHMSFNSNIDTSLMKVDIFNGIKKLASLSNKGKSATVSTSIMFIAEVATVHAVADAGFTSSEYIAGTPDVSFVQIEMPVSAIVSVDQQTLPPTPSPAGGIFAISEINARADVFDLQEEELSQLISPFSMQISEVKAHVQVEDTTSQTFGASFPAFSVLKIGDMKANVIIGNLNEDAAASSKIPSDTANTVNSDYRWGN